MNIREAQKGDLSALSDLAKRAYTDAFGSSLNSEDLAAELEANRSEAYFRAALSTDTILIAVHERRIIGYVQFGDVNIPEAYAKPDDQSVRRLYVDTRLQGKGYGRKLMVAALSHPRLAEAGDVYLQVWHKNIRAVRLYKSLGFRAVGKTKVTVNSKVVGEDLVMVRGRGAYANQKHRRS